MDGRPTLSPSSPTAYNLSLVLPAWNEEAGIGQAVAEADEALRALADHPDSPISSYEILVVDDGSRDATAARVEAMQEAYPCLRLLRHPVNRGYGAALRTGFEAARYDTIAFTDADSQFFLADLARLLPLTAGDGVAVGWRQDRKDTRLRCLLSRGYNLLARTLLGTGVRDVDCALKVFRRDALAEILPESHGFFVNTEMLTRLRLQRRTVAEAGVRHRPRARGQSKVSLGDVPRTLAALLPFWWTRVLFAGRAAATPEARPTTFVADFLSLILLIALSGMLFFGRLSAPLLEPQEPRYAEIPRQMLDEGRWLVPVLHGQAYLDKPPLFYWLIMWSYTLFGVHDWSARLVPGLAGVLTVLVTYLWGRRALGARAALCGALALCLSARFIYLQRILTFDGLLALWVTAALAAGHTALTGSRLRWRWWLLSALACGLGILTKGPVALILVLGPLVAFSALDSRCPRLGWRTLAGYLATVGVVSGPWFGAMAYIEPGFLGEFLWHQHVVRFLEPFDHQEPFWFFLPGLLLGMLPWTLLLPGLVRLLTRRSASAATRRPAALGFLLLAALVGLVFFSASGCKRAVYILPVMPPLALALGCYLDIGARRRAWSLVGYDPLLATRATWLVLAGALGASVWGACLWLPTATGVILVAACLAATALLWKMRAVSWAGCAMATFAVLIGAVQFLLPAYNEQFALRQPLANLGDATEGQHLTVVCYPHRFDSVSFYRPDAEVQVFAAPQRAQLLRRLAERPGALLIVKSGSEADALVRDLPDSVEFVRCGGGAGQVGWIRPRTVVAELTNVQLP